MSIFLMLVLLALSGNMALIAGEREEWALAITFVIMLSLFLVGKKRFSYYFVFVCGVFLVIFAGQAITLSHVPVVTIAGFYVKLFIAYFAVRLVSDFSRAYLLAISAIIAVSLPFWVADLIGLQFGFGFRDFFAPISDLLGNPAWGSRERAHIGIHNFQTGAFPHRNSAWFWEPGAFAGYLLIGLILLSTLRNDYPPRKTKAVLAFLVAGLVSTQSTMGLVLLPLALLLFVQVSWLTQRDVSRGAAVLIILATTVAVIYFYVAQLDFMSEKMVDLYRRAVTKSAGWELSRFGSALFDWEYIRLHPVFGWGQSNTTQFMLHRDLNVMGLGNGLTGFTRQMGVVGIGIFAFSAWRGFRVHATSSLQAIIAVALLLLMLNGEYFLNYPLFLSLMFLGEAGRKKQWSGRSIDHGNKFESTTLAQTSA